MGWFSRRDPGNRPAPPASRSEPALFDEDQFLVPRGVNWTVQDLNMLEARGEYGAALERWQTLLTPFADPRFASHIQGHKSHRVIWVHIGLCHRKLGQFDKALEAYDKAASLARSAGDNDTLCEVTNNIGVVHRNNGEMDLALRHFASALRQAEALESTQMLACAHDNLAVCHLNRGDLQSALEEAESAYAQFASDPSKVGDSTQSRVLGNLGLILLEMGDKNRAIAFMERGLKKARDAGDRPQELLLTENLANASVL